MERDHIRMKVFGDIHALSPELQALVAKTDEISSHYEGFQANICLNYGGRDDCLSTTASASGLSTGRTRRVRFLSRPARPGTG